MVKVEERVKVAKTLIYSLDDDASLEESVAAAVSIWPNGGDDIENMRDDIIVKLADLIDPTCEPERVKICEDLYEIRCSACRAYIADNLFSLPSYCPNCGARIVKEDE